MSCSLEAPLGLRAWGHLEAGGANLHHSCRGLVPDLRPVQMDATFPHLISHVWSRRLGQLNSPDLDESTCDYCGLLQTITRGFQAEKAVIDKRRDGGAGKGSDSWTEGNASLATPEGGQGVDPLRTAGEFPE